MKKNFVRIVAAVLVAMLALTLIPMGAFAATVAVYDEIYGKNNPTWEDYDNNVSGVDFFYKDTITKPSVTIKTSDYKDTIIFGGELYDLKGVFQWVNDFDPDDEIEMKSSLTFNDKNDYSVSLGYVPHQHSLSYWYSDGTTHWRECLVCKQFKNEGFWDRFMYQNWCQDGDEDGICNVCGGDVPYHDIKVIEVEGAKITLNRDNASHRTKITADVEAEDGYKVGKLHFVKVRDNGSRQEITRYKKDGQFWTYMPTYEMEVSVDVTKTK